MPAEFSKWLNSYLSYRGLTKNEATITEIINPLMVKLAQLKDTREKFVLSEKNAEGEERETLQSMVLLYDRKIEATQKEITTLEKKKIKPGSSIDKSGAVWSQLMKNDMILKIEIQNDWIKVYTKQININFESKKLMAGRMMIGIRNDSFQRPLVYNCDFILVAEDDGDLHPHPNVNDDNELCMGTFIDDLIELDKFGKLTDLIALFIFILENPGDDDEGYRGVESWAEEKEPIPYKESITI